MFDCLNADFLLEQEFEEPLAGNGVAGRVMTQADALVETQTEFNLIFRDRKPVLVEVLVCPTERCPTIPNQLRWNWDLVCLNCPDFTAP